MKKFMMLNCFFLLLIVLGSCEETVTKYIEKEKKYKLIDSNLLSEWNISYNIDSPAMWISEDGTESMIIATSKSLHSLFIYSPDDLKILEQIGSEGNDTLQFKRPNGIFIIDNLLLVCERDNHRIQILSLPDFKFIGFIGENNLIKPYGVSAYKTGNSYQLYVTDDYQVSGEIYPPQTDLNERIKHFSFEIYDNQLNSSLVKSFGEISGDGVLWCVESILVDNEYNRVFIAEEDKNQNNIKLYNLEGNFKDTLIGVGIFDYQVEGIMLYETSNGNGYYFVTDQDYYCQNNNTFHIFDRKTLSYIGSFISNHIENTDGIWITNKSFSKFQNGALIAVNNDGGIGIIDMKKILNAIIP